MKLFPGKNQNFWSRDYSPQVPDYQDIQLSDVRLKEFCCTSKIAATGPIVYRAGFKMNL
jgi:hypothetical protein